MRCSTWAGALAIVVCACGGAASAPPSSAPAPKATELPYFPPNLHHDDATASASASASASAEPPQPEQPATFAKKPAHVGLVRTERTKSEYRLLYSVHVQGRTAGRNRQATVETTERRDEVLAVNDQGVPTKLKVKYNRQSVEQTISNKHLTRDTAVVGKTFIVEAGENGRIEVTDPGGKDVPYEARYVVMRDFKHLGEPDGIWSALPARTIQPGESLDDMAKAVQGDLGVEGIEEVTIKFEGAHDVNGTPAGIFDVEAKGKFMGRMEADLTGTIALRQADGWELETDVEGPIHFTQRSAGSDYVFQSTGRLHMERTFSYDN